MTMEMPIAVGKPSICRQRLLTTGVTVMKILRGTLTETRFEFPKEGSDEQEEMKVISKKRYEENQVAYMADELGLHRITNEGSDFAVSLHCE